jgi:hypothetical protein
MSPEVQRQLNFLASMPSGTTTMSQEDLKELLLEVGDTMLARGRLYNITPKHLGAGVYKVSLTPTHP